MKRTRVTRAMALHEAGHSVVADALGFEVACIRWQGKNLASGAHPPERPSAHEWFLIAAWSLAGGVATMRAGSDPGAECASDMHWAIDAGARAARGMRGGRAHVIRSAGQLAYSIVDARWSAVQRLAKLIIDCEGRVSGRAVRASLAEFHGPTVNRRKRA